MDFRAAYATGKKERPPFLPDVEKKQVVLSKPIPKELRCPLCGDIAKDAVVIPCCGISYCDDCKYITWSRWQRLLNCSIVHSSKKLFFTNCKLVKMNSFCRVDTLLHMFRLNL